jgi:hypothetical protein
VAGTEPLVRTRTVNPDSIAPPAGSYCHAVRLELDGATLVGVSGLVLPGALLEVELVAAVARD